MKNILFLFALLLVGCSSGSDSEPEAVLSLDKTDLSLSYNIEGKITINGVEAKDCSVSSSDEFVAEVYGSNPIEVTGKHVGECIIKVTYKGKQAECNVKVTPLYDKVGVPVLDFGISKSELISKVSGTIKSEGDNRIEFQEKDRTVYDTYHFDNDKLVCVGSEVLYICPITEIDNALIERYKYVSSATNVYWFSKTDLLVRMNERGGNGGYHIIYAKDKSTMSKYYQVD